MPNHPHYDVIIIGAGPAGLACASELKDSDLQVLIIEKNDQIGPKICAGGLTYLTGLMNLPAEKTRLFKTQTLIINQNRLEVDLDMPLRTVSRDDLGKHQYQMIADADNVNCITGTKITEIGSDRIVTDSGETLFFKHLVGADGAGSVVRKHIGLQNGHCLGIYVNVPDITDDFVFYMNPKQLKSGYIWIFPHLDKTNIGVYYHKEQMDKGAAKKMLIRFLEDHGFRYEESALKCGMIPFRYRGYRFNNVYLIGDAAGLTLKRTGEGISLALISGTEVARKIKDPDYRMDEFNKVLRMKKKDDMLLAFFNMFPWLRSVFLTTWFQLKKKKIIRN